METIEEDKSMFESAQDYLFGKNGKPVDVTKSLELLEGLSNKEGTYQSKALFLIGTFYEYGEVVERDFKKAMSYFNKSADLGDLEALYELGFMWETGKGVPVNKPLSLLYYTLSSQGRYTLADLTLGYKYAFGHDVVKSCPKAANKYQGVAKIVSEMPEPRQEQDLIRLSETMDSSNERTKEDDIVQFYQYSADIGDPAAQVTMGTLYLQGAYGVPRDYHHAFDYFQQAANRGDVAGISNLGFMYAQGLGTDQDNETAIKLYREAANKGNAQAQTNLGFMYWNGYGVQESYSEALRYFKLAADQGYAEAQVNLGTMYYTGEGVKQDFGKALSYFSLAAQQGNLLAVYNLAEMHHHGLGTPASCLLAVQLYKKVAEKGPWSEIIEKAHKLFINGEYESSLLRYEKAAQWGFEISQSNAGYMYDKGYGINLNCTNSTRYIMAFEYYRNSAEQKNAESYLKIGDYYYYGIGTNQSYENSALYYQAASEMRNPQALFNLGYMHQYGLGLPKDLYLAKRYYDYALSIEKDAWMAVYIALLGVGFEFITDWYKGTSVMALITKTSQTFTWDTIMIILIALVLGFLVFMRQIVILRPGVAAN
jgi:SEL1 protein